MLFSRAMVICLLDVTVIDRGLRPVIRVLPLTQVHVILGIGIFGRRVGVCGAPSAEQAASKSRLL